MPLIRKIIAPAAWASALVNGDYSGLKPDEATRVRNWLDHELGPHERIIGCEDESRFTWSFRFHGGDADGGDVLEYTTLDDLAIVT